MKLSKGFTLIELLVIITIIGLLASIVLVSLKSARDKAKDAGIMESLNQVKPVAQLIFMKYDSYSTLCDAGTLNQTQSDYGTGLRQIESKVEDLNGSATHVCRTGTNSFCVSSPLNRGGGFCVDSTGYSTTAFPTCVDVSGVAQCQ